MDKVLNDFQMTDVTPVDTPMATDCKLRKAQDGYESPPEFRQRYQRAIGSIMYTMLISRPDIAYAVKILSQYSSNPDKSHWTAVQRVLRYLKGTKNAKLVFKGPRKQLNGYTDAAYKDDPDTRKSTSGYCFNAGSAAFSWSSKKQSVITTSTTHSEFLGEFNAAKEAKFLIYLAKDLWPEVLIGPVPMILIRADNNGAIGIVKGTSGHSHSKHFDLMERLYLQQEEQLGNVSFSYVNTDLNVTDILTKPLTAPKFTRFREQLGVTTS